MNKKSLGKLKDQAVSTNAESQSLAECLAYIRGIKKLTLRDVEQATEREVSNAYLSQLETGKINRPSPNVLHALSRAYNVPYELLMGKAGYISPTQSTEGGTSSAQGRKQARKTVLANESLSQEEEERLLEYLAFLRSRKTK